MGKDKIEESKLEINKGKFYLYDRWFYLLKESVNKLCYTSRIKDNANGILIEIEKEAKNIDLLYFKDKKLIAKLNIRDIDKNCVKIHYQEQEPQQIKINDNIYVNLLLEVFTEIDNNHINNKKTIIVNRKKKLNKMCYYEPDFPIGKELDLKSLNIESDVFEYFLELMDYIKMYLNEIVDLIEPDDPKELEDEPKENIINLDIKNDLWVYDRNYTFDKYENNILSYVNNQDGKNIMEVKLSPNSSISDISFTRKESTEFKSSKSLLQIIRNELGGVTVRFSNRKKAELRLTGACNKDYDNAKFSSISIFDINSKLINNSVEIKAGKDEYNLTAHPYFSNTFIDEYGNDYRVLGGDFNRLYYMTDYAPAIFKNMEKELTKKIN